MSKPEHTIATVYGPVGFVVQEPGEKPTIQMRNQWQHVAADVNCAIEEDRAFCGPDYIVRYMSESALDDQQLTTLSAILSENSNGDLWCTRCVP